MAANNPLLKGSASNEMTAARAQQFARWAQENGDHEKALAWSKYARELAASEPPPVDFKMRAAGE